MADVIAGDVTQVISGNTFDVNVTQYDNQNENQYKTSERVRIANLPKELDDMPAEQSKKALELGLSGKAVICEIQSRDAEGTLVCDVFFKKQSQ